MSRELGFDNFRVAYRLVIGHTLTMQLAVANDASTPLVFEDMNLHLLGMQAVPTPHENWKTMLMSGDVRRDHVEQFGRLLGSIHHKASERAQALAPAFEDRSFFQSLRLEPYYEYAAQQVPAAADFSGMAKEGLMISSVIHKAYIDVSEEGTEAAAATGAVISTLSYHPVPTVVFNADRPFIFVIRDNATGCILFMGKVVNPLN